MPFILVTRGGRSSPHLLGGWRRTRDQQRLRRPVLQHVPPHQQVKASAAYMLDTDANAVCLAMPDTVVETMALREPHSVDEIDIGRNDGDGCSRLRCLSVMLILTSS